MKSAQKIDPILEETDQANTGKNSLKTPLNFTLDLENSTDFSLLRCTE